MKVAIYARVSTDDKQQDPDTQLYALRDFCSRFGYEVYREYVDKARAKDFKHRTSWAELLKDGRQRHFQIVLVYKLDRAFRSVRECCNQLYEWDDKGIKFMASSQDIDTSTAMGKYFLHNLASFAELESGMISDRVKAGIARTRAQGNRYGRKAKPFDWSRVNGMLLLGLGVSEIKKCTGYSRARIYRAIEEHKSVSEKVAQNSTLENVENSG